jgi:hypothetical protein
MLDFFKRKKSADGASRDELRELLFGDVPLAKWAANGEDAPWPQLRAAADALGRDDRATAQATLAAVLQMPNLESRHYVEIWTALRSLGVAPPAADAKHVYGVVLDIPMQKGRDTLAAYEDGSARYINFSGSVVVWDAPGTDGEIDAKLAALLAAGRSLATLIGPWEAPRPPLVAAHARISLLTPSGLHFGEGPFEVMSRDQKAAPLFGAGAQLMQALTSRAQQRSA